MSSLVGGDGRDHCENLSARQMVVDNMHTGTQSREALQQEQSPARTWSSRTFRPLHAGGIRLSLITLASTALGAGTLTTPFAAYELGLGLAIIVLLANATVSVIATQVLISSTRHYGLQTYSQLMHRAVGLGWFVDLVIALNGIGTCTSYFVFLGDFLPTTTHMLKEVIGGYIWREWMASRSLLLTVALVAVWPLCCQRRLSALRHFATLPVASVMCTVLIVISKTRYHFMESPDRVVWFRLHSPLSLARGFAVFLFAFFQHMNCCPIATEMKDPSDRRVVKVAMGSHLLELLIYGPLTICGYLSWRSNVQQNFINNYPADDALIALSRVLLILSMCVVIPINMIATGQSIRSLAKAAMTRFGPRGDTGTDGAARDAHSNSGASNLRVASQLLPHPNDSVFPPCENAAHSTPTLLYSNEKPIPFDSLSLESFGDSEAETAPGAHRYSSSLASSQFTSSQFASSQDEGVVTPITSSYTARDRNRVTTHPTDPQSYEDRGLSMRDAPRIAVITVSLLMCYGTSLITDKAATVIGLVGALCCTFLMCLFPAEIYRQSLAASHSTKRRWVTLSALYLYTLLGLSAFIVIAVETARKHELMSVQTTRW